jgi:hypothetical protein
MRVARCLMTSNAGQRKLAAILSLWGTDMIRRAGQLAF